MPTQSIEPAGSSGQMHEQTFNEILAVALRWRRKAWRDDPNSVTAERLGLLEGNLRADILVRSDDIFPVVVEVEFGEPAYQDARDKLGKQIQGTTDRLRSAIAVGVPDEVRGWSDDQLRNQLDQPAGLTLRYAVLSDAGIVFDAAKVGGGGGNSLSSAGLSHRRCQ